jgi:phosphonoacetate hydrolase
VHHGALGSFALVYLRESVDAGAVRERLAALPGIELALSRAQACERFELPPDRVGDLVVVSRQDTVVGTSAERHDLSGLDVPLRSHGGVSEQRVPLVVNRRLGVSQDARRWRNFDAFELGLNLAH